ncbi:uncharacterized protein LOC109608017 [Aethina tumida]|uniref:uncharacterized protein LOC109608017 n=1 Tax=Aethina tumida TaxID=116153 RepID=UPI0021491112|nr:uncharacterized protein LOC109608017 [Aethina tumida]
MLVQLAILAFSYSNVVCKSAPMGTFKSLSLTDCEVHGPALDMTTYLHNINQNGDKALDLNLDLPYDLDATQIMFNLDVARWDGGTWKERVYNVQGEFYEYMDKYIPQLWARFRQQITPKVEHEYIFSKNMYTLRNFESQIEDLEFPSALYGKFKLSLQLYNSDDENILCKVYEVDSTQ